MNLVRSFIEFNCRWSNKFDSLAIPEKFRKDGNDDFRRSFARLFLKPGMKIVDVGGGKQPYIDRETKKRLGLTVTGLDIDAGELSKAPKGLYDETICADITSFSGDATADLVICQALLEHVKDVSAAFESIASILKKDGTAIIFVPSRNAVFARLNLLLPERLKRSLMFFIFPHMRTGHGFPSYYDHCTPADFRKIAAARGLRLVDSRLYYQSSYFSFLFPVYVLWRLWVILFWLAKRDQAAETFSMAFVKTHHCDPGISEGRKREVTDDAMAP